MRKIYSTHKQILNEMKRMLTEEEKIRYKDDGESKEMPADSAKKLDADHPAKKAWLAKQGGDSDDSGEKVKGADLFKSKEGEPKAKSDDDDEEFPAADHDFGKYNGDDSDSGGEDPYDAADEAVENILGDLDGETSIGDAVKQNAEALKAYLHSDNPEAKSFIEDIVIDTQVSISREQVADLNKALADNGINHKVEYENIEREQDHDTRPKSPFYQDDSDSDDGSSDAVSSTLETLGDFVVNSGEEYSEDVMEDELQNIKNSGVSYDEATELISKEIEKMQGQDEWEDDEAFSPETHSKLLSHLKTVYGTSESIVESYFGKSAAILLSRRIGKTAPINEAPKRNYDNAQLNTDAELHQWVYNMMQRAYLNVERGKPKKEAEKVWNQCIKYKDAYEYIKPIDSKVRKFYDVVQKKYREYGRR